jgi:hypothetical protein
MMRWSTNRVNPAVPQRTPPAGATRQSAAAAPLGSRGGAFRAAESQGGAPAQRGPTKAADNPEDDDPDENEWPEKEPLFSRDEDKDDDGLDDGNASPDDETPDDDKQDDEKKSVKGVKTN